MDNVRLAWEWAVTHARPDLLRQMARSLRSIYEDAGWLREGMASFAHAVRALRAATLHHPPPATGKPALTLVERGPEDGGAKAALEQISALGEALSHQGYFASRCYARRTISR